MCLWTWFASAEFWWNDFISLRESQRVRLNSLAAQLTNLGWTTGVRTGYIVIKVNQSPATPKIRVVPEDSEPTLLNIPDMAKVERLLICPTAGRDSTIRMNHQIRIQPAAVKGWLRGCGPGPLATVM